MAHGRVVRKLYEQYDKSLQEVRLSPLQISLSGAEQGATLSSDDFPFADTFFYRILQQAGLDRPVPFSLSGTCHGKIQGSGVIIGEVTGDASLSLRFDDQETAIPVVLLYVRAGATLQLGEIFSAPHTYKQMVIIAESDAQIKYTQNLYHGHVNHTRVYVHQGAHYELRSAYYVYGEQMYTFNGVYHEGAHSNALLQIQGVARDSAHVLNDGMVRIEKHTGDCKGYQSINGLLLDRTSQISNEPMLEIYHSDVECSHGASVSQIEDELMYYMQSRGLSREEVIRLVVDGYFAWSREILDDTLKDAMEQEKVSQESTTVSF